MTLSAPEPFTLADATARPLRTPHDIAPILAELQAIWHPSAAMTLVGEDPEGGGFAAIAIYRRGESIPAAYVTAGSLVVATPDGPVVISRPGPYTPETEGAPLA